MPSINDRIGSQNVIRVLSNASAPPTRLVNMNDVDTSREDENGLVLVWDSNSKKFILTDKVQSATLIQTGISSIPNTTNSSSVTTGALTVAGGVGISKNLTLGADFVAAGIATFTSNIDANASVDIFSDLNVSGVSTFVGVSTFGGDVYIGGDLYLQDDLVLDNVSGNSLNISGVATATSISIGVTEVLSSTFGLKNISSLDAVTTATIETAISNSPNTFTELNVSGISTFIGIATFASGIIVTSGVSTFTNAIDANGGANITGNLTANSAKISDLTSGRVVYVGTDGELQDNGNFIFDGSLLTITGNQTVTGTLTAGLIDGGAY